LKDLRRAKMTSLAVTNNKYTYKDYVTWPDNERWEIINGEPYNMTPAPVVKHQKISIRLLEKLILNKGKIEGCELFTAPTDVVFDEYNIVQPDIFIVCDKKKITEKNIQGAPDVIFEIVSKNTEIKDRRENVRLYERFGVREYIIVFPDREYIERYFLRDGKYSSPEIFNWDEIFSLITFDIEINLWEIFEKKLPEKK